MQFKKVSLKLSHDNLSAAIRNHILLTPMAMGLVPKGHEIAMITYKGFPLEEIPLELIMKKAPKEVTAK